MQQNAQARAPGFGCASMPGGPRSGSFPNLGVNPGNCQGNMPSGPVGASLGGLTPQAAQIQEVMAMLGNLNEGQLQTVQQHMQDRFVTMQQRRGVPEVFGDGLGRAADSSFVTPQPFDVLPGFGVQQSNSNGNHQALDVFAKSEKWLTPAPTPVGTWKTREEEVLGWAGYLDELSSWAAGGSLEFSVEIQHSSRWPGPIRWSALSGAQQARSRRLMSILKAAFHDNPRCVALVNAFSEGVALHGVGSTDRMTVAVNQQANAFELLRQLTLEFCLRSRSEALSLRTQIAGRSFVLAATQTSPSSLVSDIIRKIDYEAARFSRLLGTLPMQVDTTGLKLADSDMLVVLLKSLPETVKNYVLHHGSADNYEAYRNAAMRWEEQQRLFSDFETTGNSNKVNSLEGNAEYYSFDEFGVDTVEGRCGKCGSRKHTAGSCNVDVSKIRCFRCGKAGHVSFNCPVRPENGKGKGGEKGKGIVKSDVWDKKGSKGAKGSKGSEGKGKKGKLNEVSEDWTDWTAESWDDDDYWWNDKWLESCDGQWGVSQTWWDDGSGWYCDGHGSTWQQEPVQSAEILCCMTWHVKPLEVLGLCMSMSLLTWKPRIGLWLIAKSLKMNWLTRVVCWQGVATAVLVSQECWKVNWLTWVVCWQGVATAVLMSQKKKLNWLTWVVCWQGVATAVLMSQSFQRMNWLTRVVCWQEVATAVLVSQKYWKLKWLTWVVCWQEVATAVLMSHGFVVWIVEMKLDLEIVPTWKHVLLLNPAETCVPLYRWKSFWCVHMTGLTTTVKFRLNNRLNLIWSSCDLCFHRSLTTPMLLGGFLTLVHLQVFWLSQTCQLSGQCCRTVRV